MAPMSELATLTTPAADPLVPRIAHVTKRRRDAADVWTLELELADGAGLAFEAGQFNMLTAFGVGESAISVSGDPASGRLVHTIRAVGPVSRALCGLKPGAALGVRGPFGIGWPVAAAAGQDVLLIAGGLGLAPLRPAIYRVLADRARYGRVALLYGARSPDDMVFRSEVENWRGRFDMQVEATVDHALSDWRGHVGVVTNLIARAEFDPDQTVALVCGPEIMMRFVAKALAERGMPDGSIYLSMERNMKCAIGQCGHCQFGPHFVCRDGPVFSYDRLRRLLTLREI